MKLTSISQTIVVTGLGRTTVRKGQLYRHATCEVYRAPHSEGPHTWGLMPCGRCLEILIKFIFNSGFHKQSPMRQWSMQRGHGASACSHLQTALQDKFSVASFHLLAHQSPSGLPIPVPTSSPLPPQDSSHLTIVPDGPQNTQWLQHNFLR